MRSRTILVLAVMTNLVLAVGWFWTAQYYAHRTTRAGVGADTNAPPMVKTNFLVRRQFFTWQEVESDDYPTYIANLRNIACPEQTIRDIIIADVNALYARKRATEIRTTDQQWWRSTPDPEVVKAAEARSEELDEERRALLASLLGTGWEGGDLVNLPRPSRPGVALDGPVLGIMSDELKQKVEELSMRSRDRITEYLEAQREAGKAADPAELEKFRQQSRAELAQVLTPLQLEEYLLRYSQNAGNLRAELGQLGNFNATPDEFRAMFRATDSLDQQLALLASATDPNSVALRRSLEDQRTQVLKTALGTNRFAQFQLLHDVNYRDAYTAALEAGVPDAATAVYEINRAAQEEIARIRAQTNLSPEELAIELKQAELAQMKGTAQALGKLPPDVQPPLPPNIPSTNPSATTVTKPHVLTAGEGLEFLSQLYGVTVADLRAANPNLDPARLKAGDVVTVPLPLQPVPIRISPKVP